MEPSKGTAQTAEQARNFVERVRRQAAHERKAAQETQARVQAAVRTLAPLFGISRAILIGSVVWGGFDARRSDIDIVVFGLNPGRSIDLATALWDEVGRPVHVIRAESAAPSLVNRAQARGEELLVI